MAQTPTETLPFTHELEVRSLNAAVDRRFDLRPTSGEQTAMAQFQGAISIKKLRFRGRLFALPKAGWRLEARLNASVVQACVVTLEPVQTQIDTKVVREFLPKRADPVEVAISVEDEAIDIVEPLGRVIDLGLVITEALGLALPAYPRKPGAALPADASDGEEVEVRRPFAALAALRKPVD